MKTFITWMALMLSGAFVLAAEVSGIVVLPNGMPAAGAEVALVGPNRPIGLSPGMLQRRGYATPLVVTGKDGHFSLPLTNDATAIISANEAGYVEVELAGFQNNSKIALHPWGRVEGIFRVGTGIGTNQQMILDTRFDSTTRLLLDLDGFQNWTDGSGNFVFTQVPPGTWRVSHGANWYGDNVTVKAGETNHITIGGTGRPLVAKFLIPENVARLDQAPLPPSRAYLRFSESDANGGGSYEVQAYLFGIDNRAHYAQMAAGGLMRVEDVTPGRWWLMADVLKFPAGGGSATTIATLGKEVTIPEIPGGRSDEPLDLGELKPIIVHSPQVGEDAPALAVKTADGETFDLARHHGQYVLLDFEEMTWAPKTNAAMKAVWQSYGTNKQFAMLTLEVPPTTSYMFFNEKRRESWRVAELAKMPWYEQEPLRASFGLQCDRAIERDPHLPAVFLVGPDGKIVGANLQKEDIDAVIGKFLGKK